MDAIPLMWLTALASAVIPATLYLRGRVHPFRDCFYFLLWLQALLYLHIAPALWAVEVLPLLRQQYLYLQVLCLLLFELPLAWLYLWWRKRSEACLAAPFPQLRIHEGRRVLLIGFLVVFAAVFLQACLESGFYFVRLGNVGNMLRLALLGDMQYYLIRSFQLGGTVFLCLLLVLAQFARSKLERVVLWASLVLVGGVYLSQRAANSRFDVLYAAALAIGTLVLVCRLTRISPRTARVLALGALVASYGYAVAQNVRHRYDENQGFEIDLLDPWLDIGPSGNLPVEFRLNGIDLMAQIHPVVEREGYAMGAAWEVSARVAFRAFLGRDAVTDDKLSFMASPKRYLMLRYTDLKDVDYVSCALTDIFGNFGPLGLLVAGAILATTCAFATRLVAAPASSTHFLLGLFLAYHSLTFEQEFSTLLFHWTRLVPLLIIVLLLDPFVRGRLSATTPAKLHRRAFPSHRRQRVPV